MIGQIPVSRPVNPPFSENITRKGLYCSSAIYNTVNRIQQLIKKIFEIFDTLITLTEPLIKCAIFIGLTEAAVRYSPKESNVKIGAIATHTGYMINLAANMYVIKRSETHLLTGVSILAACGLLILSGGRYVRESVSQWKYPLGMKKLPKGTKVLYQLMAQCSNEVPEAKALWERAPSDFEFRAVKAGGDGWDPDLNEIKVDTTLRFTERFNRFIDHLAQAANESKVKELFKQLQKGQLSLDDYTDKYIALHYGMEVDHIETINKCLKIFDWKDVKQHYTLFGKRSDSFDAIAKVKTDYVIQDTRNNRLGNIKHITKIWNENSERYCHENGKDPNCTTPIRFIPHKWTPKTTSHFIPKCIKRVEKKKSTVSIPRKPPKTVQERTHELNSGAFEGCPKLGSLFGLCPHAYELWQRVSKIESIRDFVQYTLNVGPKNYTQQELYELFSKVVLYLISNNMGHQRTKLVEELKKGHLSKIEFILQDIDFQWECREAQKIINWECYRVFDKKFTKKFSLRMEGLELTFEEFLVKTSREEKHYHKQTWRENGRRPWRENGRRLWCGNNPWRKGCTTDNRPRWNAFLDIARKNLYIPACSKSVLEHIRKLAKKEK